MVMQFTPHGVVSKGALVSLASFDIHLSRSTKSVYISLGNYIIFLAKFKDHIPSLNNLEK
jgi:hypothetical protein